MRLHFPPYLLLKAMLPDEPEEKLEAWMNRYGRSFDQLTPNVRTPPSDPRYDPLRTAFTEAAPPPGWQLEAFEARMKGNVARGLSVIFQRVGHETGTQRFALCLEPLDPKVPAFGRSRELNVSYLNAWKGLPCTFDRDLMAFCASVIARSERSSSSP